MLPQLPSKRQENRANSTLSNDVEPAESASSLRDDPPAQIEQAEPNTDLAIGFLEGLDPKGRHHLTAIGSNGITTASFDADEQERMRKWIDARQGRSNLYYSVNEAKPEARRDSKLTKEEIGTIRALAVDLDPTKVKGGDLTGQNFRRERERLVSVVKSAAADPQCPPTLALDSGGGFQLIWHLQEPVQAKGNIERVEGIVRTIGARLGGDPSTWNIDRIMRLPGTVNVLTPDKVAQGRTPATATGLIDYSSGKTFTLEQLEEWAPPSPVSSKERGGTGQSNVVDLNARADADNPVDWGIVQAAKSYDDLPSDLRRAFREHCQRDPKLRVLYEDGTLPPGHTDDSGSGYSFALAGRLKQAGDFTPTQFGQLLWVWPYSSDRSKINQRSIWRDWQRAVSDEPWGSPADLWAGECTTPELPPGVVPAIVDRVARDRGRRLGVEPGAPALALIVGLGSLVHAGNAMQMRQKDTGWKVKPVLWGAVVGDPGSNKSATTDQGIEPVRHVEAHRRRGYAAAKHRAKAQPVTPAADQAPQPLPSELAAPLEEIFASAEEDASSAPSPRQKIVSDTTTEALNRVLADNHGGVLCYTEELTSLIGGMDVYHQKAGKDRGFWLEAKEGKPRTVNRATGTRYTFIPNHAVSVLGGIQPSKIQALAANLSEDGLLQRFLPVLIDRRGAGVDDYPDEEAEKQLHALAIALADRSEKTKVFKFEPAADAELQTLEAFKMQELARPNAVPAMGQWIDKLPSEFGRIALVFHQVEWHAAQIGQPAAEIPELVSQDTARRARRFLMEFVFPHARVFYERVIGQSVMEEHARWIAGFILSRRRTVIEARDIYKNYTPLKKSDRRGDIVAAMYDLEMQDWVRPIGRGRHGEWNRWAVNPAAHDGRFEARANAEWARRSEIRAMIAEMGAERASA